MPDDKFVTNAKNIEEAILEVMSRVGYVQKQRSEKLSYTFAGEAALIAALRPAMIDSNITMRVVGIHEVRIEEYETAKGGRMQDATLTSVIRFTHAPSGTYVDVYARGQGADAGDKSSNKAQTGAYKYALRQTFLIETGDDPDNEPSVERASRRTPAQQPRGKPIPVSKENGKADATAFWAFVRGHGIPDDKAREIVKATGSDWTAALNQVKSLAPEPTN